MSFTLETWSTEGILTQINTPHEDVVNKFAQRMSNPLFSAELVGAEHAGERNLASTAHRIKL